MAPNRRNLYRVLQVQPDADPEVISAAYRALMAKHRNNESTTDALITSLEEAWRVLSDTARRAAYDEQRAERGARTSRGDPSRRGVVSTQAPAHDAGCHGCAFCGLALPDHVHADSRCVRCDAPLAPVGSSLTSTAPGERRRVPRVTKSDWAMLHVEGRHQPLEVRMRDLSLDGTSLYCDIALTLHQRVRIVGRAFDLVADIISRRRVSNVFVLHARLLAAHFPANPADADEQNPIG